MACLAAMARHPALLSSLLITKTYNAYGRYTVRLFSPIKNKWMRITVRYASFIAGQWVSTATGGVAGVGLRPATNLVLSRLCSS